MYSNFKRNIRGFTLLEILLALFIFTIVSAILATALHTIFNAQAEIDKRTAEITEIQTALLMFSRDIEQVVDRPINLANNVKEGFSGRSAELTFTRMD